MRALSFDVVVVGAGAAGLAAASALGSSGHSVALIERETTEGGILNQCIHNGFGLQYFKEELTGPEYADRFAEKMRAAPNVDFFPGTTAMRIDDADGEDDRRRVVHGFSPSGGVTTFSCRAVVLAMGCRERNRGNINIPGTRPAGVFTAGLAQRLVNIEGYVPGRRVVIVGSGDIGLIMARRMTWIGSEVCGVVEIQPYPSGLTRNIVQCLNDYDIPLYLSHTIAEIRGRDRVDSVVVAPLADGGPDADSAFTVECDTVLLSVGLIPDNELTKTYGVELNPETHGAVVDARLMCSREGVFACGNVLHVHDLVDYASEEAERCARHVSEYLSGVPAPSQVRMACGANVRYVVPSRAAVGAENRFYLRSLVVKNNAHLRVVTDNGRELFRRRLAHVQPSEMVHIDLDSDCLSDLEEPEQTSLEVHIE